MKDYRDKDEIQQQIDDLKRLLRSTANGVAALARVVASLPGVDQTSATEAGVVEAHVRAAHKSHHEFRSDLLVVRAARAKRYLNMVADLHGGPRPFPEVECDMREWPEDL